MENWSEFNISIYFVCLMKECTINNYALNLYNTSHQGTSDSLCRQKNGEWKRLTELQQGEKLSNLLSQAPKYKLSLHGPSFSISKTEIVIPNSWVSCAN